MSTLTNGAAAFRTARRLIHPVLVVAVLLWAAPVLAGEAVMDISGRWNSSEGVIEFTQTGDQVVGTYNGAEHGKLFGEMRNGHFVGRWIEDASAETCDQPLEGRYHWGTVEAQFVGSTFRGKWGYCNKPKLGSWNGMR